MRHTLLALANGYILYFYSERLFWGMWRPGDALLDMAIGILFYTLSGYLFLTVVRWMRIHNWAGLFIAGCILGWLVEGIWAPTLYGTEPSSPFPLSILATGVSWHALITVLFGWGAIGALLRRPSTARMVIAATGLGIFWAMWATFEWLESPPIVATAIEFALHTTLSFALLIAAYWTLYRLKLATWQPAPPVIAVVIALHLIWFVAADIMALGLGLRPVCILLPLLAAALGVLWYGRSKQQCANLLDGFRQRALLARQCIIFCAAPAIAILLYAAALTQFSSLPPLHQTIFLATALAGGVLLIVATWQVLRQRKQTVEPIITDHAIN